MSDHMALLRGGVAARNSGARDEGMALLLRAVAADPRHWQAYYELGVLFQDQGELALAEAWYAAAVRWNPASPAAARNLVLVQSALGRADAAAATLAGIDLGSMADVSEYQVLAAYTRFRQHYTLAEGTRASAALDARFADPAVTPGELETLMRRALRSGSPFAHLRLGDGEGVIYARIPRFELEFGPLISRVRTHFLRRFVGPDRDRDGAFLLACRTALPRLPEADVLAFPGLRRVQHSLAVADHFGSMGILALVEELRNAPALPALAAGQEMHWDLMRDGRLGRVVAEARGVVVVTSLPDAVDHLAATFPETEVDRVLIPPPFDPDGPGAEDVPLRMFPDGYLTVLDTIGAMDLHGRLVLVGGGPLGKLFVLAAKRAGGVVLDVGAVLDVWGGLHRPNVARDFALR